MTFQTLYKVLIPLIKGINLYIKYLPGGSNGKETACNVGDPGLIPGLGRSAGEGSGYSLQYSCLKNSMDRGTWWATVHGVTESQTQLSNVYLFFIWPPHPSSPVRNSPASNSLLRWPIQSPSLGSITMEHPWLSLNSTVMCFWILNFHTALLEQKVFHFIELIKFSSLIKKNSKGLKSGGWTCYMISTRIQDIRRET